MKNCTHCKYAEWDKTKTGRLSPTGDGVCGYMKKWKTPPIPACAHWGYGIAPIPEGSYICRREELSEHCPYYQEATE